MVEHDLSATFAALSDPTRRDILVRLASAESTVTEIAEPYEMSLNAVSKHVMVLESAGLVRRTVEGRTHRIALEPRPLRDAVSWLEMYRVFWDERLDALEQFLRKKKGMNRDRNRK